MKNLILQQNNLYARFPLHNITIVFLPCVGCIYVFVRCYFDRFLFSFVRFYLEFCSFVVDCLFFL